MIPQHHPSEEHLLDYVSGQLDSASRVLLEAHLAFCEPCRNSVAALADPGVCALPEVPRDPALEALLPGLLARLAPARPPMVEGQALPLPRALWPLLPDLSRARWRGALTPGFRFLSVPMAGGPDLQMVRLEAGRPFPRHSHGGFERQVILTGGLEDGTLRMEPGDFDESRDHVHEPRALPDEPCILLACLDQGIRFTGWRGALQRLAGA